MSTLKQIMDFSDVLVTTPVKGGEMEKFLAKAKPLIDADKLGWNDKYYSDLQKSNKGWRERLIQDNQ